MAISKQRKEEALTQYSDWLKRSQAVILVEYSGAKMKDLDAIRAKCDAITAGTAYDLGLYTTAAVVNDVDYYATNVDFSSALTTLPVDLLDEARDIALGAQAVWADAAATADSRRFYYLSYTADTVGSAAGQIVTRVHYVDGGS